MNFSSDLFKHLRYVIMCHLSGIYVAKFINIMCYLNVMFTIFIKNIRTLYAKVTGN